MKTLNTLLLTACVAMLAACDASEQDAEVNTASAASSESPSSAAVTTCDHSCLLSTVDQYIAALVANNPAQAPFTDDARFTENTVELALGNGLWNTASALPDDYKLVAADPQTGNAAFYMMMEESGSPIWLSGRLHVSGTEIDELETVIIRSDAGFSNFSMTEVDPEWNAIVPPEQRSTRDELAAAADGYVETLEQNLAGHVKFSADCNRIENGAYTANNPQAQGGLGAASCQDNVDSGMWLYITEINPRRILVLDEERGIAMGVFMFHHSGQHDHAMVNGERVEYSGATRRPFTTVIPEMFKVRGGEITRIVAMMTSIPYRSDSGWDER